ncbi:DEAD/DEAH box helicase [Rhodococcus artemisiae]|uniref:DEAD/DEAH box helicase n=1 Tax=Rhodococcus artemisiae TaxID=714159 RepID=A0ABU7LK81_9NOCA|nr:DEAD/DEAH box helicase [Rhodococcus artemisiae]MEE2061915.1 DEAD/DEAH box helicase [Rhodococcus artemisiae]
MFLHGLWSPGSGLVLWREPDEPTASAESADGAELPSALRRWTDRPFRHRVELTLPGDTEPRTLPAVAIAPPDAAELLLDIPRRAQGIAGDLRFLVHVARGIERWAQAGRVAPELVRAEKQWWARWRLLGGEKNRAWLAELAAAMPPVQRQLGRPVALLDDMCAELTDPIVRGLHGSSTSLHPLVAALAEGNPHPRGSQRMADALDEWRASLAGFEPDLVLRLVEPDDSDDADVGADALWRLEVCLQTEGQSPVPLPVESTDAHLLQIGVRKLGAALNAYPRLQEVPRDPDTLDLLLPTPVVIDLVEHGARALHAAGVSLLLPRAWATVDASLRLTVNSSVAPVTADESSVGMNAIVSYEWQLAVGDMLLTHSEMEELVAANSDLVKLRGKWVRADNEALARAAKYVNAHSEQDGSLGSLFAQFTGDDPPPVEVTDITASGWVETLLDGQIHPDPVAVPKDLRTELRPYQQRGLDWLAFMTRLGLGAVLADDMGLGKTVQVLALLAHEREVAQADGSPGGSAPTLLVCPMSVVGNWHREAERFVPGLRVYVHHGPQRLRGDALAAAVADHDLVITTYAIVARDIAQLVELSWRRIVLDEAQHVKNASTGQSRATRAIPSAHRIALTGTPVENRLEELRSILDFANPKLLGSAAGFRAKFAVPIERDHDSAAAARLRALTAPFVLRRVKTDPDVISDLPEKFEQTVRANLTAEQAALYRAVVDDMMRKIRDKEGMARKGAVLAALTRLKQVCNHPAHYLGDGSPVLRRGRHRSGKLGLIEDIVESVLADGEKVLLFTQFREFGTLIAPYLEQRFATEVPFLHGGVPKRKRDDMVTRFQQEGAGPPIMLLSLKAGGTGLNLTAANHVVHLDRWWNPAVENQATDRAFRIGQRRDVQVRKLVCVGTVEERIDEMLAGKQELADLAVGVGENWITELSTDQLHSLLTLGDDAVGD